MPILGTAGGVLSVQGFNGLTREELEEGNYFDQGGAPVKGERLAASAGIFVRLRPFSAGEHTIVAAHRFTSGDILEATFHVTVSA